MAWIFVSVLLIAVVYLAVQFPAFRKAIWICLVLIVVAVAAGAGWLYYGNIQSEKRAELSRHLIRPDEIVFTNTVLSEPTGVGKFKVMSPIVLRTSLKVSR